MLGNILTIADRDTPYAKPGGATVTERSVNLHCWQKPISPAFQLASFAHSMDCWHPVGHVRTYLSPGTLHRLSYSWEGEEAQQHKGDNGEDQIED